MKSLLRSPALLLAPLLLLSACGDDDPTAPGARLWREVALDLADGDSRLLAVDFTGDHGVAVNFYLAGSSAVRHTFLRRESGGAWAEFDPGGIDEGLAVMELAVDAAGGLVLAGFQYSGPLSFVRDLRGPAPVHVERADYGMTSVEVEGSFAVAGGRSRGGGLWTSTTPDAWTFDDLPLTGTNDSGFRDIDIRGGHAVACGYDDGADTLQVILARTAATAWRKIPSGGPATATYLCIAQDDDGTIYLGGMEGAGGPAPRAFLSRRTADGVWTDLELPDPAGLHGVMDILVAADGSLYLACYGEGDGTEANLVHGTPGDFAKELTPFPGGLYQVDQAADGTVYAVGFRRNGGDERGVMLVRSP